MLENFYGQKIREHFPYKPTSQQTRLIDLLGGFLSDPNQRKAFLLKGYAGTGKTSVIAALVKAMQTLEMKTILLAPTGRAAKVLASYAHAPAYTIHKQIYRCRTFGETIFSLRDNLHTDTLFVVDEASMISNASSDNKGFGSGRLLDDLVQYIYSGKRCSLLLLGDDAQLPPVMQESSPAMNSDRLKGYNLHLTLYTLTHVVRQTLHSGILHNATLLRQAIVNEETSARPIFQTDSFDDIKHINSSELADELQKAYDEVGITETIVITRSNKHANLYNQGIRNRIMYKEDEISNDDLLMLTRNNYFWAKQYDGLNFLANGDMLSIERIRQYTELYGCRFVDLSLRSLDYDWEIDAILLLDSVAADTPERSYKLSEHLFHAVGEDYPEIHNRKQLVQFIKESPYFNALQAKFAYAITCHKAQGGQWKRVFIDQGLVSDEFIGATYYRWLYTALTRSSSQVYLINFRP